MPRRTWTGTFWPKGQAAQVKTGHVLRILSGSISCYCEENLQWHLSPGGLSHDREEQAKRADALQSLLTTGHPQNQGS